MGFIDEFADAVESTARKVGRKTEELVASSKKSIEAASLREKLDREYEKLGRLVASNKILSATAKVSGKEFTDIFDRIDELKTELDKMGCGTKKCECGKYADSKASFCQHCGKKL